MPHTGPGGAGARESNRRLTGGEHASGTPTGPGGGSHTVLDGGSEEVGPSSGQDRGSVGSSDASLGYPVGYTP